MSKQHEPTSMDAMRIDKWLWAARFFKTRSIAKAAIEGGKVHHQNERVKVSKEVRVGMQLTIQQGLDKKRYALKHCLRCVVVRQWLNCYTKKPKTVLHAESCMLHKENCII